MKASWSSGCLALVAFFSCLIAASTGQNYTITSVTVMTNVTPGSLPQIGSDQTYTISCSVELNCSPQPCYDDTLTIDWTLNGEDIDMGHSHFSGGSPMPINIVTTGTITRDLTTAGAINVTHAGIFNCTASLESGSVSSNTTLTVQVPPPTVTVSNSSVDAGNSATLTCSPSNPGIDITFQYSFSWSRGSSTGQSLTINPANIAAVGQYVCSVNASYVGTNDEFVMASNQVPSSVYLYISIPTPAVLASNSGTVIAGNDATISCTVTLTNLASYSTDAFIEVNWNRLSSVTIQASNSYTNSSSIMDVATDDSGDYICTARVFYNGANAFFVTDSISNSSTTTLMVQIPAPTVSLTSQTVAMGATAVLNCSVAVSEFVSDNILNDLQIGINITPSIDSTQLPRSDRTFIYSYNAANAGTYTCTANVSHSNTNIVTSPSSNGAGTLYVVGIGISPTEVIALDAATQYNSFNFTCSVSVAPNVNNPRANFTWSRNGSILGTESIVGTENTLTSGSLSAGTYIYTCSANVTVNGANGIAMPSAMSTATIRGPASPVQPVLGSVTVSPSTATVSWTIPRVTYTPENYTVLFGLMSGNYIMSSDVMLTIGLENQQFINATDTDYETTLTNLDIGITYYYVIQSNNTVGTNTSNERTFTTAETVPAAPSNVQLSVINSSALNLTWAEPSPYKGNITDYNYTCTGVNVTMSYFETDTMDRFLVMSFVLTGLEPFREYNCSVSAATSVGPGPAASDSAVTGEAAPTGPPLSFNITSPNPTSLSLSWSLPENQFRNGIIVNYSYYCLDRSINVANGTVTSTRAEGITFGSIRPYTNYTCFVSAATIVGSGPAANANGTTAEDAPSAVTSLAVARFNDTSFTVSWGEPMTPNGIITLYTVNIYYYANSTLVTTSSISSGFRLVISHSNIMPFVPYVISVNASTNAGNGISVNSTNFTREGAPPPIRGVNSTRINDTAVNVSWIPLGLTESNGFIQFYNVSLTVNTGRKRQMSVISMSVPSDRSSVVFTGLDPGLSYTPSVQATTRGGTGSGGTGPTIPPAQTGGGGLSAGASAAIGVVFAILAVILIIAIVIAVVFIIRNKRVKGELTVQENAVALQELDNRNKETNGKELELVAVTTSEDNAKRWIPVPVKDFPAHTMELHGDRDLGFEDEYKSFKNNPQGSYMVSKLPHNISKNRFDNVFPYDSSRVELTPIDETPGTDYINASFIDGYRRPKAYIAAQGPLLGTVGDFWRMTWEFQLPTIVMLTELIERGIDKCACYWPRALNETIDVGFNLKVTLIEQQQYVDYRLKKFLLLNTSESGGGRLDVTHYHFLAWPDHGVPADKTIMLAFIRRVRQSHPPDGPPLIVHCSAGVGRTGTFITLDTMQQRLDNKEDSLNIYEFLADMRTKRVLMVQTEAQYVYIHDALSEYITCGDTSITTKMLKFKTEDLEKVTDHKSGYERQLELLNKVSRQPSDGHCIDALSKTNSSKNRYPTQLETLPYDMTRVRLKTTSGVGDYINASHVDGYKHRGAFLATQAPLESTVEDLWRMIWEQWTSSVVMLCNLEEDGKEACARYWPENVDDTATYGKMIVKLVSEETRPHYIVRKIMLSQESTYINMSAGSADHLMVTQYHYVQWPESTAPKDETPILKLLDQLLHNQMNTGNKAITVMCNDGIGRTGVFMSVYSLLERIKIEGVADVFQYIKGARFNRPGLVKNVQQYQFCHEVVLEYLNSFDAYHNF